MIRKLTVEGNLVRYSYYKSVDTFESIMQTMSVILYINDGPPEKFDPAQPWYISLKSKRCLRFLNVPLIILLLNNLYIYMYTFFVYINDTWIIGYIKWYVYSFGPRLLACVQLTQATCVRRVDAASSVVL